MVQVKNQSFFLKITKMNLKKATASFETVAWGSENTLHYTMIISMVLSLMVI